MHLGDAEPAGHSRLRDFLEETVVDDPSLTLVEPLHGLTNGLSLLNRPDIRIDPADGLPEGALLIPVFVLKVGIQRGRLVDPVQVHRLEQSLLRHARRGSHLRDRRRAAEPLLQLLSQLAQAEPQFPQPPGRFEPPGLVAEVTLDLTEYRRYREGDEADPLLRVETVQCGNQADVAHLDQIVLRGTGA